MPPNRPLAKILSTMKPVIIKLALSGIWLLTHNLLIAQIPANIHNYITSRLDSIPEIKAQWNRYNALLEQARFAGGLPDPSVSSNIFIKPIQTRVGPQQFSVSATQSFPFPGTLKSAREAWTLEAEALKHYISWQKANIYTRAANTWLEYVYNTEEIRILNEHLELLTTLQRVIKERVAGGSEKAYNYLRIQMQIEEYQTMLKIAIDRQQALQVAFNKILNLPDTVAVPLSDSLIMPELPDSSSLFDSILTVNPLLISIRTRADANKARQRNAKLSGLPSFKAGLSYFIIGNGGPDAIAPTIGIRLPIYRKKWKSLENRYALSALADSLSAEEKVNFLTEQFYLRWWSLTSALEKFHLYEELTTLAKHTRQMLLAAYSGDEEDFVEILRIDRDLLNYTLSRQKALTEVYKALVSLYELTGK